MPNELTPAQIAAEEAGASGGFEDDLDGVVEPVIQAPTAAPAVTGAEEDEVVVPEGARNPDAVQRAIQDERKKARAANARARELETELAAARSTPSPSPVVSQRELQLEVALDLGIPKALAIRLQGSTKEELEADAKTLMETVGAPRIGMEGGFKPPPAIKADPKAEHNALISWLVGGAQQQ